MRGRASQYGGTALLEATRAGSVEMVARLLAIGADIADSDEVRQHWGTWFSSRASVEREHCSRARRRPSSWVFVSEIQALLHAQDGKAPVSEAVRYGHPAVLTLLLDHGADIDVQDQVRSRRPRREGAALRRPQEWRSPVSLLPDPATCLLERHPCEADSRRECAQAICRMAARR